MRQTLDLDIAAVMPAVLATGLLSSLCTITVSTDTFDAGGAPVASAAYVPVAGMVDIPCTAPPLMTNDRMVASEVKRLEEIRSEDSRHVLLGGYYPAITDEHRALIDGVEFDIVNTEWDSQKVMTRIAVERVTM